MTDEEIVLAGAAIRGDLAAVTEGLNRGVPPNIYLGGPTLLNLLAERGQVDVLRLMLSRGADPNSAGDNGFSALMSAAMTGQLAAVNVLLDHGADRDLRDANGRTALDAASINEHVAVVERLRRRPNVFGGADPMRQMNAFFDVTGRLRRVSLKATFASMGWSLPPAAGAALGVSSMQVDEATIAELRQIETDFLALAGQPAPAFGWPAPPLAQAAECSRLSAFILDTVLGLPARAATQYRAAQAGFERAGLLAEAREAAENAAACVDVATGNVEQRLARARAAAASAPPSTVSKASCLIQLGEIQLQTGNQWAAIATFKDAEATLKQAGYDQPPAADAILSEMMASIAGGSGSGAQSVQRAGNILKLRLLFHRLYSGLKVAYGPVDAGNPGNPSMADHYAGLIERHQLLTRRK
ncbi:ankyrin repeat domain-containing protein [Bradyrhizobium iriomotense]|uniref:ankyrin repeat domain-containing protein n=1 Tax=Bradyrhizobium iriomotense TaxID=441950 RepID=UPI001B8A404D|nr:ankyrin repeat domain-containing protein [Bradyrhizobium iriomotense]MBR0783828.1 ankyrin repeat domain-containing protein [Bradyrhizobium iriomotense]